jgi:hypothetical protein
MTGTHFRLFWIFLHISITAEFFLADDLVMVSPNPHGSESIPETATLTLFGLFEYCSCCLAQFFQRLMDHIFCYLPFVFYFDHLIGRKAMQEHLKCLDQFFSLLQDNGLQDYILLSVFMLHRRGFFGHV